MDPEKIAQKIIKIFDVTIKEINAGTKTIVAVVSTNKADRHGDIVTPESFKKRLKHYKDHPVLLSSHDYYDLRKQIGEATKLTVTDDGLEAHFKYYAGEGNPEADWAWVLAQKKIAAFSIGFMNHEFEWIKEKNKETGSEYITGRRFLDIELLEVSQVLIPANRQSIQERNDYAAESGKLAEMAVKAMESGEIKEVVAPESKKEEKTQETKKPALEGDKCPVCSCLYAVKVDGTKEKGCQCEIKERSHYSEKILEDGSQAHSPSHEDVLRDAVKDAATIALQ